MADTIATIWTRLTMKNGSPSMKKKLRFMESWLTRTMSPPVCLRAKNPSDSRCSASKIWFLRS